MLSRVSKRSRQRDYGSIAEAVEQFRDRLQGKLKILT
jgi:hypothetical protein